MSSTRRKNRNSSLRTISSRSGNSSLSGSSSRNSSLSTVPSRIASISGNSSLSTVGRSLPTTSAGSLINSLGSLATKRSAIQDKSQVFENDIDRIKTFSGGENALTFLVF